MRAIKFRLKGEKVGCPFAHQGWPLTRQEWKVLLDLDQLALIPKLVRPLSAQEPDESRRLWDPVTQALLGKQWNEATRQKQVIEQRQRDKAARRKEKGEMFAPEYFGRDWDERDGRPELSEKGRRAVQEEVERAGAAAGGGEGGGQAQGGARGVDIVPHDEEDDDDDDDEGFEDAEEGEETEMENGVKGLKI